MMLLIPLMIIPLALYNGALFGFASVEGVAIFSNIVLSVPMMSGAQWELSFGDVIIVVALICLFIEIIKATRTGSMSVVDHMLSTFVFIAFLIEFLLVEGAATQVFFILTVITFIDVVAGFSVSIRSAGRDVSIGL